MRPTCTLPPITPLRARSGSIRRSLTVRWFRTCLRTFLRWDAITPPTAFFTRALRRTRDRRRNRGHRPNVLFGGSQRKPSRPYCHIRHTGRRDSLYNTPPCFAIYVVGLVAKWVQDQGGLKGLEKINRDKAALLYSVLNLHASFYQAAVSAQEDRSLMNVTFRLQPQYGELEKEFLAQAAALRHGWPQGPSRRGRLSGEHLQRLPGRRRGDACRVHAVICTGEGLTHKKKAPAEGPLSRSVPQAPSRRWIS